jgi:uncharacterized membrane protein YhaH (DUF805 family)
MTNIFTLLSTFTGRISRRQWWIGFVITFIASVFGTVLFNPELFTSDALPPPSWRDTFWQLAWLVPGTAITIKRFNDRDWPWWLGYAFAAAGVFLYVSPHFGLAIDPEASTAGAASFWLTLALFLAAFLDNGFMRGTRGPNRYGPDPLTPDPVAQGAPTA